MFDFSSSELLVIVVVAVVVVGPKDLPRMMRTVGQWAGRARTMADQFRRSFDDMARQSELDELRAEVEKLKKTPLTDEDYKNLGITEDQFPSDATIRAQIEDVGAAPPKLDTPEPVPEAKPEAAAAPQAEPAKTS
jgi:sec-independent protein translocase protein TatB